MYAHFNAEGCLEGGGTNIEMGSRGDSGEVEGEPQCAQTSELFQSQMILSLAITTEDMSEH